MPADFPIVDRNRLVSNASKTLLELTVPASWHIVSIAGDGDFGLDVLVQLAHDGGVQHAFYVQLKGTESADIVKGGAAISYPLKRRTLNLYASLVQDVMLAVALVVLDETGKLVAPDSKICWQWMSRELEAKRGSPFTLDVTDGKTSTVHLPSDQILHPRLDVSPHLQKLLAIARAAFGLEDLLRKSVDFSAGAGVPALVRLADVAKKRPQEFIAWLQADSDAPQQHLPDVAHEIRTLIRAGNTEEAEAAIARLGPDGLGATPSLHSVWLSLRGKIAMQRRNRTEARQLFEAAYAADPTEEHLLSLAETQFLAAVDAHEDGQLRSVCDSLNEATSDDGLGLKARVHVALKEFASADACLSRISEAKQVIPRLVLLTGQRRWHEAITVAKGVASDQRLSTADLTAVRLLAARAAWHGATDAVVPGAETAELPLAGAAGTDLPLAREAWHFALECMRGLRAIGWSPNVELIAPIVSATAAVLGHHREALALMTEASQRRPEYAELQLNLELLAIASGEAETALVANQRQQDSDAVLVRRTGLLFQLRRFAECLSTALSIADSFESPDKQTPIALAMGYAAAHRVGRPREAEELRQRLSSRPDWGEFLRFAEFARLGSLQPKNDEPLAVLRDGLIEFPKSSLIASNLYSNLRVSDEAQAIEAVTLAKQLRQRALLTLDESLQLLAALTTLKRWDDAAAEAGHALERFGPDEQLLAMGAVAQEMLGRTANALAMLERAMAVGTDRIAVVHNYMALALRLGRMGGVRAAIDRLLGLVTERAERLELMRLSALVYVHENRPYDAQSTALSVGQLVDPSVEQEEGMYLNLIMAATLNGPPFDDERRSDFARRVDAFCTRWPQSRLFRRIEMPAAGITGLDDLHGLLDPLVGDSRAKLREFEARERQARRGELAVPFIVRPGFLLHYIGNPFELWAVAKRSKPADRQFHLSSIHPSAEPKSPGPQRDIPLLDLTALLVLDSLDLFDKVFLVFSRIAIPRLTVAFVSQQANSVLGGGLGAGIAKSILGRINSPP